MTEPSPSGTPPRYLTILVLLVSAAVTVGVTALLVNIFERKREASEPFFQVVELRDDTIDPAIWGRNFPLQYDGYKRTVDQQRTRFGGSEAMPRTPSQADPRSVVAQSRLEEDPRLRRMWAGYAFSLDFREERGHAYMLDDQSFTSRQQAVKQPGTCVNCHASVYVAFLKEGNGDLTRGFEKMNALPYAEARTRVEHPVACIDCHDPKTTALRVTRPAFMEGMKALKSSQGVTDYDVNRDATRQEMRAFVCGQCHDEYYFKGSEKRLVYPWHKGLRVEDMLAHYDEVAHNDWEHQETGAPVLKAQHPEFELWSQGIHARTGVACADCHMPYTRVGALKISDHHVRSPLLNISRACQTCHKASEAELKARVETIQERTFEMRNTALDALLGLIDDLKGARASGVPADSIKAAQQHQRRAQFFLDFIEAENSMGFHADQEAARILVQSLDSARKGQVVLRSLSIKGPRSGATTERPVQKTPRARRGPPRAGVKPKVSIRS